MNSHDRDNLQFILSLNDEEFDAWTDEMTDDDIQYAMEILQAARKELADQEQSLTEAEIECELEYSNFAQAHIVLQKFRL